MIEIGSIKIILKSKGYVKENWGSPFIVGFMLLLIVLGVSLSMDLYTLAETISVYAFYALAVGVFLQIICFIKYCRKNSNYEVVV